MTPDRCALLYACYRSGQIEEDQWQAHLREDANLREYMRELMRDDDFAQPEQHTPNT